ncbi:MAG TPA: hypothetical protein VLW25_09020 [Bryobacteraceae bacterium]|nr:hypothetical protein [Bryobacteraceae bacterium]
MPWKIGPLAEYLSASGIPLYGLRQVCWHLHDPMLSDSQPTGDLTEPDIERPKPTPSEARGCEEVCVNPTDPFSEEPVFLDQPQDVHVVSLDCER